MLPPTRGQYLSKLASYVQYELSHAVYSEGYCVASTRSRSGTDPEPTQPRREEKMTEKQFELKHRGGVRKRAHAFVGCEDSKPERKTGGRQHAARETVVFSGQWWRGIGFSPSGTAGVGKSARGVESDVIHSHAFCS
jgi:hypothetical protein